MNDDNDYMRKAIDLAWKGIGRASPNPMVGCLIVKDGQIVGEGAHIFNKIDHAETLALRQAGERARGATVYVTLEPCSHHGRTPPCVESLIAAGISKVVYGLRDPDPRVNGSGHALLEKAGIKVVAGILEHEIRLQNKFFVTAHSKNRPFVLLKWAMTADGKIATRSGDSKWISSELSRNAVHHLRNIYDAVLVGHSTVMTDNPRLTCRVDLSKPLPSEIFPAFPSDIRHPQRIVIDAFGATCNHGLSIFEQPGKTIAAVGPESEWDDPRARDGIDKDKIEILECPLSAGHIDLQYLLGELKTRGILSIMVEGGSSIHAAFLNMGLADEVLIAVAPKIFGGEGAPSPVGGGGIEKVSDALCLQDVKHITIGDDVLIHGRLGTS